MLTVTEDKFTLDLEAYQHLGGTVDELSPQLELDYACGLFIFQKEEPR